MRYLSRCLVFVLLATFMCNCTTSKKTATLQPNPVSAVSELPVVIYQTTDDYSEYVPVILSDDKKSIASYPGINDIYYKGKLALPTRLHNGYWLDNRGIAENVAFIKLTYKEYSRLSQTPSGEELMSMIMNDAPLKKMYICGRRSSYADIIKELNAKIDQDDFTKFVKIK